MKRFLVLFISTLLIATLSICASAAEDDLSSLTNIIVPTVNDLLDGKLSRRVSASDVNYDDAFKIYVGVNVFKMDTVNVDEMKNALEDGGYIYEIPLYIDGDTVLVDIAIGKPLDESVEFTEEERQKVLANVGKWQVTTVKFYNDEIVNYTTEISNKIGKIPEGTILVGGLPRFRYAVALIPNEKDEVVGLLPLSDIPGVDNIRALRSAGQSYYDYKETRKYINQLPPLNPDEAGGSWQIF